MAFQFHPAAPRKAAAFRVLSDPGGILQSRRKGGKGPVVSGPAPCCATFSPALGNNRRAAP
jgi:hypothetical protein